MLKFMAMKSFMAQFYGLLEESSIFYWLLMGFSAPKKYFGSGVSFRFSVKH